MKQNKVYFGLLICAILLVIAYSAYSMLNYGREETPCRVSVILDDSANDRWTAFREGLSQGADDCNMRINVVSLGNHVSLEEEYQTITREIEGGAQGIILQACLGGESAEQLAEVMQNKPLVLVDTDIEPEEVYTCVLPDSSGIGQALADALRSGVASVDQGTKLRVGVLAGNQNMSSLNQRLTAFLAEFDSDPSVEPAWVITEDEILRYGILAAAENSAMTYQNDTEVDCIVALDDTSCGQAIDYMEALGLSNVPLYAVGCSEKSVYYLDQGIVTTLIVPNEFTMGYESVAAISSQTGIQTQAVMRCTIDFMVADRDNLYDKDVQRMLFPIVQ